MRTPMVVQSLRYEGEVWLNGPEFAAYLRESEQIQRERGDPEGAEAFAEAAECVERFLS